MTEITTDAEMLDLESRRNALQGQVDTIGENMRGLSFEQAQPLEKRSAEVDGELLKIEAQIAEAPAEGLVGVAVKLRLLDLYRDLETQDPAQQEACTRTALEAVERLLISGERRLRTGARCLPGLAPLRRGFFWLRKRRIHP